MSGAGFGVRGLVGLAFSNGCVFGGGAAAIAVSVDLDDVGVVDEAIDSGDRDGGVREHLVPFAERLIAGDHQAFALVALGDELKQYAGFGLVFADVAEIVEDQAVEPVELGERRGQDEIAACGLQFLDEIGGSREQHAITVVDEAGADG